LERLVISPFDTVSSISQAMLDRLPLRGIASDKHVFFPNWVDTDAIYPLDTPSPLRAELGLRREDVVALYSGNMGRKQGLEVLLEAARLLQDHPSIHFVLSGDGSTRQALVEKSAGMPNVLFLSLQPAERLNGLLNLADIHLLMQGGQGGDAFMPSKLTGMLASGRPVVATAHPRTQVAQVVTGCGMVTPPGDTAALAHAILHLATHPTERAQLGQTARTFALAHWSREGILRRFEKEIVQLR